ncbi:MAG TPA: flavodoxin-dependent (E)-4-hydroxy-3-methylbut-2-enyl-diphosphate synthase [Candidatus Krumholzibacteriaceae bacterium]|nr:flavodoxin-dependent (E)-4-hydroxy-3-methylbut-2-enyl-diphosphate synthase [Candidatus Krumholzibacteriaceae bacterium]
MNKGSVPDRITAERRKTRKVYYGNVPVGGGAPISIQSMSTRAASDREAVLKEFNELASAGCEIARVSVKDQNDIEVIGDICKQSPIPVIADIHFDFRLAVRSAGKGVAGLRINPGNIGGREKVREVARAAEDAGIPIRIGVNSGSLQKNLLSLYRTDPARALYESAAGSLEMMESIGFENLLFSIKSSDPMINVDANRLFASACDYPIHIGVTEAGPVLSGATRSAVSLTLLLSEGIGDTLRVSLSGDPVNEVIVASALLSSLRLREDSSEVISCPTCGRAHLDVLKIASLLEREMLSRRGPITVAVMGCEVNGPGEAKEADVGIAGTAGGAVLFAKGKKQKVLKGNYLAALLQEIDKVINDRDKGKR